MRGHNQFLWSELALSKVPSGIDRREWFLNFIIQWSFQFTPPDDGDWEWWINFAYGELPDEP